MDQPFGAAVLGTGCECVVTHAPAAYMPHVHHVVPQSWGGSSDSSNLVKLCPNSHYAAHSLLNAYVKANGVPDWEIRKHYGPYVRSIAERGWAGRPDKPTFTITVS